jgi:hypothetical protein
MASESQSGPYVSHRRRRPSGQAILAAFLALLILFLWLDLILAIQIEVTGREIQAGTAELAKIRRQILAVEQQSAAARALDNLAGRASELGYQPQEPVFLMLSGPLGQPSSNTGGGTNLLVSHESGDQVSGLRTLSLWAAVAQSLDHAIANDAERMP